MKIRSGWGTVCVWALAACGDPVLHPDERRVPDVRPTATTTPVGCDRVWNGTSSRYLMDSLNWTPTGAPGRQDHICFGAGTYTVEIFGTDVGQLRFLPGADVTLATNLIASCWGLVAQAAELWIEAGATATTRSCISWLVSGTTRVDGTLVLDSADPLALSTGALLNFGVLDMRGHDVWITTSGPLGFLNAGELRVAGTNTIEVWDATTSSVGGVGVTGAGTLRVDATRGTAFEWTGGSFPTRRTGGEAAVSLSSPLVTLGAATRGALDIVAPPAVGTWVTGTFAPSLDLALVPPHTEAEGGTVLLSPPASSAPGTPVLLEGTLAVKNVVLESTYDIRNTGTLLFQRAASNPGLSVNRLRGTTFRNEGQLSVFDSTRIEDVAVSNIGTIRSWGAAGNVVLAGGSYTVDPAGSVIGRLSLEAGGALSGNGTLDHVVSLGGVVSPGSPTAPYGALTFADLTLDAASQVDIDVGGLATLDRVTATTRLALGGALTVRTNAPFVGGLCGQVVSPLGTTRNATLTGGFAQYNGTSLTTTRRWRPYVSTTSLSLVGHDPSRVMGVSSTNVAVSESGNVATTQLCFSGVGPTANVTVTPTARFGQSAAAPSPLVVTPGAWALPHTLTVSAINDLVAEPAHSDSIRFQLTSTDGFYNGPMQQQVAVNVTDNDPPVDLTVSLVSTNPAQTVGQGMERRFRVSNLGPGASTGSTFSISSLVGATFTWSSVGTPCAITSGTLQCAVGAIPAGGFVDVFVVFTASTTPGTYTNTLRIRGNDYDNVNANNTAPWVLTVN